MKTISWTWVLSWSLAVLPGCGGHDGSGSPAILVEEAWARAMPLAPDLGGAQANSAVYILLRNDGTAADRLIGAETSVAGSAEIHESLLTGDVMRMRQVGGVEILPGERAELRPGGLHIMLLGLEKPLLAGEAFDVILRFERSGDLSTTVQVRPAGSV
jgi:copper(I)-binding protein